MSDGISPNKLNDLSQVYIDQVAAFREIRKQETQKDIERWSQPAQNALQQEAKVDTGSAEAKASARNKRNTPPGKDSKFDTSVFITRKPGESLDSARTRKRREAHDAKRGVKESWSDWRTELREVLKEPETEAESQKEVVEKKVKNKIEINPKISEAIEEIGGEVLSVEEQDTYQSHIEDAVEYFYEQGINERGVELIIEEVGLEDFVEFVIDPSEDLMEARKARRANVKAKSYAQVKKEVDTADAARKKAKKGEYAASYAKKETDVTDYGDDKPAAMKKAVARKKAVLKQPIAKKATPAKKAQTQKKVVKSVAKVKKVQPAKPVSKKGIRGVIQRGVERHQKAVGKAKAEVQKVAKVGRDTAKQHREHGKKFISGLRATPKEKKIAGGIAKAAKKALTREEYETQKKKEVLAALKRDKRPLDTKTKEKIASDIVKKKGDTSKSDDRYAYEAYTVTAADKKGNTPAWKRYKAGAKNVKTGEPLYKKADHVEEEITLKQLEEKLAKGTKRVSFSTGRDDNYNQAMKEKNPKTGRMRATSPELKAIGAHSRHKQKQWDAEAKGDHKAAAKHKSRRDAQSFKVYQKTKRIIDRADND